jgi:signal transduction histidine kinase
MRERLELIGGSLIIESTQQGTVIKAVAPWGAPRHA